jgi:hypothetical protein
MKIAVLILAFNSSLGLKSLVQLFNSVEIDVYVHVDAKIDAKPFCSVEKAKVKFICKRGAGALVGLALTVSPVHPQPSTTA